MSLKLLLQNNWLTKIVIVANIVGAILVWFVFSRIDTVVNVDLYKYDLQFNSTWYNVYLADLRLGYICLGIPIILSLVALGLEFVKVWKPAYRDSASLETVVPSRVFSMEPEPKEDKKEGESLLKNNCGYLENQAKPEVKPQRAAEETKVFENKGNLVISCPNCKKVFGTPMVMVDFAGGKDKLINVCPYCSQSLGEAQEEKSIDKNIHAADMNDKLKH
jgi:uncharacterized Zn-finger protein